MKEFKDAFFFLLFVLSLTSLAFAGKAARPVRMSPSAGSPTSDLIISNQNAPMSAGWVKVVYSPRDLSQPWSSSNTNQWIVEGEFPSDTDPDIQRGTLLSAGVHVGQYRLLFRIRITALGPLPYGSGIVAFAQ